MADLHVIPNPTPNTGYNAYKIAKQISNTVFQDVNGSQITVLNTVGNVLPNPGDWVLIPHDALGSNEGGFGQTKPTPDLTATVVSDAVFQASYSEYRGQSQNATPQQV